MANAEVPLPRDPVDDRIKEADLAAKQADAALKIADAELKKKDLATRSGWNRLFVSPVTPAILTAVVGFFISLGANYYQQQSNLALEREKLKSNLIVKAIETGKPEASAKNLLFLLDMKLIDDATGSIEAFRKYPERAPVLASPSGVVVPRGEAAIATFFSRYQKEFGEISSAATANLTLLFNFIEQDKTMSDLRQVAYVLATIRHETSGTFAPATESCQHGCAYGERYRGRGYILLTWEANYKKLAELLGVDIHSNPDLALDPVIAYRITSIGMAQGTFSGKKLSDYITSEKADYVGARRIINPDSRAEAIATAAIKLEQVLRESIATGNAK